VRPRCNRHYRIQLRTSINTVTNTAVIAEPLSIFPETVYSMECFKWHNFVSLTSTPPSPKIHGSQDSVFSIVTRTGDVRPTNRRSIAESGEGSFLLQKRADQLWSPRRLLFNGHPKRLFPLRWSRRVVKMNHSPKSSVKFRNELNYTSTPTYLHSVHRDNFTMFPGQAGVNRQHPKPRKHTV
jgi:hypothetical protein